VKAVLYGLMALILALLAGTYFAYRKAYYVPRNYKEDIFDLPPGGQYEENREHMFSLIRDMAEVPFEPVSIISYDGKRLNGRYYHVKDGAPVQIQMHGYRGSAFRDFCGGNRMARKEGQNVILVDQRAHGRSQGRTITFGIRERQDCLSWINYALCRFGEDTDIVLSGVSMGAATVLMATELDLPENVRCVIADSPFSSPSAIIKKVCGDMGLPPKLAYPFAYLGALIFGGFRLDSASAVEAVKKAKIPALIIHGEGDGFVPCEMSREIYEAYAGEKRLVTFPEADHGISYIINEENYAREVLDFLKEYVQ